MKSKDALAGELIIHIGLPKTGSTYLQEVVFEGLDSVVNIGRPNHLSDEYVNFIQALGAKRWQVARALLVAQIAAKSTHGSCPKTVLWSDEDLCRWLHPEHLTFLGQIFPKLKLTCVVRDPVNWIESMYSSHGYSGKYCGSGRFITFDEFMNFLSKNPNFWIRKVLAFSQIAALLESKDLHASYVYQYEQLFSGSNSDFRILLSDLNLPMVRTNKQTDKRCNYRNSRPSLVNFWLRYYGRLLGINKILKACGLTRFFHPLTSVIATPITASVNKSHRYLINHWSENYNSALKRHSSEY